MPEMMSIVQISKRLNLEVTTVRRLIARTSEELGLKLHRGKGDKLLLENDDAERLISSYEARRGMISEDSSANAQSYDRYGFFYVIQLVPEALPNRVKIGFADNVEKRLIEHQSAAPTARLVKAWPCKRSWDYAAMDSITRVGCKLVLNEVYEGEIQGFIQRADAYFAVMPNPDNEKEHSEYSPLYNQNSQEEEKEQNLSQDTTRDGN
jgi:hypothetical protein